MPLSQTFTGGSGLLEGTPSDQGKSWVELSGSLSLFAGGLSTDVAGDGKYYLDDDSYGVASPPRVDLNLNLPTIPSPDEAFDIWLFAFGNGPDGDSVNFLSLQIECPPSHVYKWTALSIDVDNGQDFTDWANLAGPPSQISIDPQTQKFYIDNVLVATLGNAPTWGAGSRVGVRMSFVTGVNVYATSINSNTAGGVVDVSAAETGHGVDAAAVTVAATAAQSGHGADAGPGGSPGVGQSQVVTYRAHIADGTSELRHLTVSSVSGAAAARAYLWMHLPAPDKTSNTTRIEILDVRPASDVETIQ